MRREREASLCRPVIHCLHLPEHTAPLVHRPARPIVANSSLWLLCMCFVGRCSSLLFIRLWSPCWIVLPLTKPDSSLPADSCSLDQAAPSCMVVLRLFQQFNKCRKGRKVSVRCLLCTSACMNITFYDFRVFCDDKLNAYLPRRRCVQI